MLPGKTVPDRHANGPRQRRLVDAIWDIMGKFGYQWQRFGKSWPENTRRQQPQARVMRQRIAVKPLE
jgi:hypothetical protein